MKKLNHIFILTMLVLFSTSSFFANNYALSFAKMQPILDSDPKLIKAIKENNFEKFKKLLNEGESVNVFDDAKGTPLDWAIAFKNEKAIDEIFKRRPNVNTQNINGAGPLHCAAMSNNTMVIKKLVDLGCLIDKTDNFGITALQSAAVFGLVESIELLINLGANKNMGDHNGLTPLHYGIFVVC